MAKGVERDLGGKIVRARPGGHARASARARLRAEGGHRLRHARRGPRRLHGGVLHAEHEARHRQRGGRRVRCRRAPRPSASAACTWPAPASQGLKGETLSEMGDMVAHGAVAFTDDGRGVQGAGMMRRVMDYAAPVRPRGHEPLPGRGPGGRGPGERRRGVHAPGHARLAGRAGEEIQIARDIALCRLTGCPLHVQHLTTARGLELVRAAKAEGLPVTCEVTPHHLFLTEDAITRRLQHLRSR